MEKKMDRKLRVDWIDVTKGFTILIMILGHCLNLKTPLRSIIFSFHMPLFLILSGYFYKVTPCWKTFIKKQFKSLMIPYICAIGIQYFLMILLGELRVENALVTGILSAVVGLSYTSKMSFGMAQGTGVLWFLPLLFVIRIIFRFINEYTKENIILSIMITISITLSGYWLGKAGYWLPFSFDVAMYSMCFYGMGYFFAKYNLVDKVCNDVRNIVCLIFVLVLGIYQSLSLELAVRYYPGILTCILVAVSGSFLSIYICKQLCKTSIVKTVLTWYGKKTVLILCIHHLEWVFITYPESKTLSSEYSLFIYKLAFITIVLFVINALKNSFALFKGKRQIIRYK